MIPTGTYPVVCSRVAPCARGRTMHTAIVARYLDPGGGDTFTPASGPRVAMPSALAQAKRALIVVIRALAASFSCPVSVGRDSADQDVHRAFRQLSRKVHPDKPGGGTAEFQKLTAAHDLWAQRLAGLKVPTQLCESVCSHVANTLETPDWGARCAA